jgi:cell division septation protein DedD
MASQDDSFREIQLGGKALVFLAMATVVILVGVFLMGLQVGRGVLSARGPAGAESTIAAAETEEPSPPPASATPGASSSPATAGEKLSYAERLGSAEPLKEPLKPEASTPAEPPAPKAETAPVATPPPAPMPVTALPAKPTPAATAPPAKSAPAAAATPEPAGNGFAIQVAALREPGGAKEADAMVKRLAAKGYPAYIVTPQKGDAQIYRVRVGKFKERREADTVAARLQKEEQFKPWIVR